MRQIRQGVFETNSSSVHSLSFLKRNSYMNNHPVEGFFGEFGWGNERLVTPADKLSYVLVTIGYFAGIIGSEMPREEAIYRFLFDPLLYG